MFASTIQGTPEHPVLRLEGSLTLEHATQIHAALMARLAAPEPFSIDLRGADRFDLSFLQMLHALLKNQSRRIGFLPLPEGLVELAASVGADSLIKDITTRIEGLV
jgi:anti-anti-sigma regulatory factor